MRPSAIVLKLWHMQVLTSVEPCRHLLVNLILPKKMVYFFYCIVTQYDLPLPTEVFNVCFDAGAQTRDMSESLYDKFVTYMETRYCDTGIKFHRDTSFAPPPSKPLFHQALFHRYFIKNGRRYTAASMMELQPKNSLVLAHLYPSNLPWVGEIMNILTIQQSFGQEACIQIRWLKPISYHIHDPTSI